MNFAMLAGLAGISLPILAHLLSRKKYDIVPWGAMQFLDPGRNARRRIRLEELLLLFLRMAMIVLIVLALARPWVSGGIFSQFASGQSRDVVFVIDGSYSMGWEGNARTPHAEAIQFVHDFLEELRPGDSVALLDARAGVRAVIESPTRDFSLLREHADALPDPSGSSDLATACVRAVQMLSRTSSLAREVIVLTDGQSLPWSASDSALWAGFDDLLDQPGVRPRIWLVNTGRHDSRERRTNFSVDRIRLSRELTVAQFPVRISTRVRYSGGVAATARRIYLEADGQRLSGKTVSLNLQPDGEATAEFEYRVPSVGSHVISVVLEGDDLPGDDRADASVSTIGALPVLLVDGDWNVDPTRRETFFAKAALNAAANRTPWIRASVVAADRLTSDAMNDADVVVLANVDRLTETQAGALQDHVSRGGGLVVTPGDRVDSTNYNALLYDGGQGPLPASLLVIEADESEDGQGQRVRNSSLQLPWIQRYGTEHDSDFTEARFDHWWRVLPAGARHDQVGNDSAVESSPAIVVARLQNHRPLIVTRRFGRGTVALLSVPIDADWSTLPAKQDFVSLLHEMIFHVAGGRTQRNIEAGEPILLPVAADAEVDQLAFFGPDQTEFDPERVGDELEPVLQLSDTRLPGIYRLGQRADRAAADPEYFVVNFDRRESDLTPLSNAEIAELTKAQRMTTAANPDDLRRRMFRGESRTEFWYVLLLIFLGMLVFEVVMTRRLVRGGRALVTPVALGADVETNEAAVSRSAIRGDALRTRSEHRTSVQP